MATKDTATQTQAATTTTPSLAAKILAVKNAVGVIAQDSDAVVGGGKKINYASLTAILKALTPILAANHLDYEVTAILNAETIPLLAQNIRVFRLCFIDTDTNEVSENICYPFRLANNPEAIKSDGSTITYAQRYLLGLAFGLQTELDPDANFDNKGNGDNGKKNGAKSQQQQPAQQKVYTFEECSQKLYAYFNVKTEESQKNAKTTYDFIVKNWSNDPRYTQQIAAMKVMNLG